MNDRIEWLDKCKLIGIWLVILGHLGISKNLHNFIYAFHMPLFFFISGYLYKINTKFNGIAQLKKNIVGLLWPYCTFYLLNWLILFLFFFGAYTLITGNNNITFGDTFLKPLLGLIYGVGYDTENSRMLLQPVWFLLALFIMKLIFDIVTRYTKNIILILLLSIVLWFFSQLLKVHGIDLYWSIDSAFTAVPFFAFGFMFKTIEIKFIFSERYPLLNVIFSIFLFVTLYYLAKINGAVDINSNRIGHYSLLYFINALIGIMGVVFLCQMNVKLNKYLTYLAQNTLLILFLHYTFILLVFKLIPQKNMSDFLYFIFSIITLVLMYYPVLLINIYLPFVISPVSKREKS